MSGALIAIEGADGAGKRTASEALQHACSRRGLKSTIVSFPRYQETVGGAALGEFLSGRTPVPVTPEAAAVLYALDRFESRVHIAQLRDEFDLVIFDRYIGSNVAYQAAKVAPKLRYEFMSWIATLELETFSVPPPSVSIFLDTPRSKAQQLIALKATRTYTDATYDVHEADQRLQLAVRDTYLELAASKLLGRWHVVSTVQGQVLRSPADIAEEIWSYLSKET